MSILISRYNPVTQHSKIFYFSLLLLQCKKQSQMKLVSDIGKIKRSLIKEMPNFQHLAYGISKEIHISGRAPKFVREK